MLAISLVALLLIGPLRQADSSQLQSAQSPAGEPAAAQPNESSSVAKQNLNSDTPQQYPRNWDPAGTPAQGQHLATVISSDSGQPLRPISPEMQKKIADARARNEPHRQAAIRINQMAANIHSEKDARALVDAVAEELTNHKHLMWAALSYRRRVAHAEFQAVSAPDNLIPDERVADIWNEYVREIDAPEEALVTQLEIHRMRQGRYRLSKIVWDRDMGQSIWNMPNVHAVGEDGSIADGGRPLEMLDILNSLYTQFPEILFGRGRQREPETKPELAVALRQSSPQSRVQFLVMPQDPIRPAEARYIQAHGEAEYDQLVRRLFDEFFPPE